MENAFGLQIEGEADSKKSISEANGSSLKVRPNRQPQIAVPMVMSPCMYGFILLKTNKYVVSDNLIVTQQCFHGFWMGC